MAIEPEPHALLYLNATLVVHGTDDEADARLSLVTEVLTALGCTDVSLRERDREQTSVWRWCDRCYREAAIARRAARAAGEGTPDER